jgi:hypothetical protein
MPTITQARLDEMLSSGEVSLTPDAPTTDTIPEDLKKEISLPVPGTEEKNTGNEDVSLPSLHRPKPEYTMPTPEPMGRPLDKEERKYLLETRRSLKDIANPEYRKKASEITRSGARISDIDGGVAYWKALDTWEQDNADLDRNMAKEMRKEDLLRKRSELRLEQKQTRDRSKLSQTIGEKWADLGDAVNHLDKLIDNYHPDNVGVFDAQSPVRWVKRQFGSGEGGTIEPHENSMTGLETALKKAFGFGANYSDKEQEMMRRYMPSDTDGEESYKRQVSASARAIKRLLQAKIETQGLSGYETGELKKMLDNMDRVIERADQFAGIAGGEQEDEGTAPKNLRSLRGTDKKPQDTNDTHVMSREEKLKLLRGEG